MVRYEDPAFQASMKIKLDVSNMMQEVLGEKGFTAEQLQDPIFAKAAAQMTAQKKNMGFRQLPYTDPALLDEILQTAAEIREKFEAFVILGIGGSALGPIAVQQALNHLRYNELPAEKRGGPRFYVEDNIDPARMEALFDVIDVKKTCFNVITKSGSTSETMAQFLIIADKLKQAGVPLKENMIATTDKEKGNLIKIARQEGLKTFIIPDGVGGRFSEMCPVGLVPAARLGNGYRDYDQADVERARRVHALIAVGLSCEQVLSLVDCLGSEGTATCPQTRAALAAQLATIEERIERLEATRRLLRDRLAAVPPAAAR